MAKEGGSNFGVLVGTSVYLHLTNQDGNAILCTLVGAGLPASVAGFAIGCLLLREDDGGKVWQNTGSATSCTFTTVNA